MSELSTRLRTLILHALDLAADGPGQQVYQRAVPGVNVARELIEQWDDVYRPSSDVFREGFDAAELEALKSYDELLATVASRFPGGLPSLEVFVKTPEWRALSEAARRTLQELKTG